jgi:isopenicillin-N epimerase
MYGLKDLFQLDPKITYLNHGSFGACPKPVFEVYQGWQRELERQPTEFLGRNAESFLVEARAKLSSYLSVKPADIVYFPNPTTAINMVARNLFNPKIFLLNSGDEILTTNHEYGALDRTWRYFCKQSGALYTHHHTPLPVTSHEEFIESFWRKVTTNTRVIFISHITSPTALIFPVKEICQRAREAGILTIVDGAHAPGHIEFNLEEIGADIYVGACHKWLCAPKGSSFLYAHQEIQNWLDPLVVSWGYESDHPSDSQFIDYHEWQGTRDLAAFLSVPTAIEFQTQHQWKRIRQACHALAIQTRANIDQLTGQTPISSDDWVGQMVSVCLPDEIDCEALMERLYEIYHIEVPVFTWNHKTFIRISYQGYNTPNDAATLTEALTDLLEDPSCYISYS